MMRVAVVTPYYKESLEFLRQNCASVSKQTHPCQHVLVADGCPQASLDDWEVDHIRLPRPHRDIGSTPRLIGAYHAIGLGFDAVAFLDADNWYRPDHIESLVRLHKETGAAFLSSNRMLCRIDGSSMARCLDTDPEKFIDTNCMMFTRAAFPVLSYWCLMPDYAHLIGDRVMVYYVRQAGISRAHSPEDSVFYRCGKSGIYRRLGEPIPDGVEDPPDYTASFVRWVADGNPALV